MTAHTCCCLAVSIPHDVLLSCFGEAKIGVSAMALLVGLSGSKLERFYRVVVVRWQPFGHPPPLLYVSAPEKAELSLRRKRACYEAPWDPRR